MSHVPVRRLLIDLNTPFAARWNGGDAFSSAFFNALSMSFPVGEQYFMDSVRRGLKTLPEAEQRKYATEVQGFVGQEATHRRIHELFNKHLEQLGYTNAIERRTRHRIASQAHREALIHVATTAAAEHFTALFAKWMLNHPEVLAGAEPRLRTLWTWHCAEELEHRTTAFDIYTAMGGSYTWRMRMFRYITMTYLSDVVRQTVRNLWHDGSLFKRSTWQSAAKLLFAKDGLVRSNTGQWRDYMSRSFHPRQHDACQSQQWLQDNTAQFAVVGKAA